MGAALVVGAGAIGRGFVPWCVPPEWHLSFVDTRDDLVADLGTRGSYRTWMTVDGRLVPREVSGFDIHRAGDAEELLRTDGIPYDVCFVAVGPRNVERIPRWLGDLDCPVFSLENDPETVPRLRELIGTDAVHFGIPDVITSSSASPEHLRDDPWSLHTEAGTLYLRDPGPVAGRDALVARWCTEPEMARQWEAKLLLHNAPHAIAAYLGARAGHRYMHEAMADPLIATTVRDAIDEILAAMLSAPDRSSADAGFLHSYAEKELRRFRNPLLFDPVSRVARQPLRKLRRRPHGRLTGVVDMCLGRGVEPRAVTAGIVAALAYREPDDDRATLELLEHYGVEQFLWHFVGVEPDTVLSDYLCAAYRGASG